MNLVTSPDKMGSYKETLRTISNICFVSITGDELWKSEPILYIYALQMIALDNKLCIFEPNDYDEAMCKLIKAVNYN
jgi:hypothetical protein